MESCLLLLNYAGKFCIEFGTDKPAKSCKCDQNHESSMVNFSQIPVTNEVKIKQNFDLLSTLLISTSG